VAKIIDKEKYDRLYQTLQEPDLDLKIQMFQRIQTLEDFNSASLHNIGSHYCTDKVYANRTAAINYLQIYEMYFERFKHLPVDIMEIGVRAGESINTWNKYFANANSIYGVEIDDAWWESLLQDHIHYVQGDATETAILDKFPSEQEFDIIIDDGSHINEQIIKSFKIFYPRLKSGGIYVIEDLYNSYGDHFSSNELDISEILGSSSGIEQNKRIDIDMWLHKLETKLNNPHRDILFIHHWDSIIIIGKV
jgi:hypothetical protein